MIDSLTLTDRTKAAIKIAQAIAKENMHQELAPAHLLKALMHKEVGLLPLLKKLEKDFYYMEEWAEVRIEGIPRDSGFKGTVTGNSMISAVINEADSLRLRLMKDGIDPEHTLAALCTPGVGFTYDQLKSFPLRREELLTSISENDEVQSLIDHALNNSPRETRHTPEEHAVMKYCIDKSIVARAGKLDAIIGRDKEIRMMGEILCRRSKPNVLIIGEPGVGKTALVDGFALAILQNKVPKHLLNACIFELDTGALIAGASYKGEVEERLKNILKEIKQFGKVILFIDEIHTLLDKNSSLVGSANLLKPELARGNLTVIGATTSDEYRRHIEKDEAFSRRFELLQVEEPDAGTCFQMIKAVMPYYEKHHAISVPDDTIHETIRFAKRYIKDRRLPDAAIDLTDRTMAALRMINDSGAKEIEELKLTYDEWCSEDDTNHHFLEDWKWFSRQVNHQISPILWSIIQSESDACSMKLVTDVKDYLHKVIKTLQEAVATNRITLEKADVAAIVSSKTGIPVGKVQTGEGEKLLNMGQVLKQRVVGQDHAIKSISDAILVSRSGLGKPGQPIGCFFFLGPTGTGKTELAKSLAELLFHDESSMIRFDMSEFKEKHDASLLLGAPPGFVGYEEGGLLVSKIRQKPYSVVLFDEIEKANPSVFDLFLQIMDEGKLHDKLGREGDFSNAIILFTSNIGSHFVTDTFNKGEFPSTDQLMEVMAAHFRPEFLGRLTEIIPFAPITLDMVESILKIQLKSLHPALEKQYIQLTLTENAFHQLAQLGFSPTYGARPVAGIILSKLVRPISAKIISGEIGPGKTITIDSDGEGVFKWQIGNCTDIS